MTNIDLFSLVEPLNEEQFRVLIENVECKEHFNTMMAELEHSDITLEDIADNWYNSDIDYINDVGEWADTDNVHTVNALKELNNIMGIIESKYKIGVRIVRNEHYIAQWSIINQDLYTKTPAALELEKIGIRSTCVVDCLYAP